MHKTIALIIVAATSALLTGAASAGVSGPVCGDVNHSGSLTTSDALAVLKASVGQPV